MVSLSEFADRYLAEHATERAEIPRQRQPHTEPHLSNGQSGPADRLDETATWADILEPHGWIEVNPHDASTLEGWRRPGATSPVSAKVPKANPHVLVVWSTDAGLPTGADQKNTKFRVYTHLNYSDESAASKALLRGEAVGLPPHIVEACRGTTPPPRTAPASDEPPPDDYPPEPDMPNEELEGPASWAPVDLTGYLDGTHQPVQPNMFTRTDGISLIYPGLLHSFHGESESCKSMTAQSLCVPLINSGQKVLYLDFESDPAAVTDRLLQLGASHQAIRANFHYVRPEVDPRTGRAELHAWFELLHRPYRLAVIDGVGDALGIFGYTIKDNDDIATWMRILPKQIADRTGASVLMVDQVTKDSDTRGRFAIGGQAKMAGLTGAAYTVEIAEPVGIGLRGVVVLRVAKDRPGYVRGHCGPMRKSDRTQEAARITIDSTNGTPTITIDPWRNHADPNTSTSSSFRPTAYMEKVSRALEAIGKPLSFNGIDQRVTGNQKRIREAIDLLVAEGYVSRIDGPNNSQMHTLIARYEQASDPQSDQYQPADTP